MDCKRFNTFITRNASFSSHKTETENQLKCRSANASKAKICDQARRPSSIWIPNPCTTHPSRTIHRVSAPGWGQSLSSWHWGSHLTAPVSWQIDFESQFKNYFSSVNLSCSSSTITKYCGNFRNRYCYLIAAIFTHHRP